MEQQVALVFQGGGTRSAFTAGVADALLDLKLSFSYVIGTSAGALCAANFLSGDRGRTKEVAFSLMKGTKFVSLHNLVHKGSFFDFNYLFSPDCFAKFPFNREAFQNNTTVFYAATTDLETGGVRYFQKGVTPNIDLALAASSSIPLLTKKPLIVEGHPCLDGGSVASIPFRKPLEDGIKKIIVVTTRDKTFRKGPDKASKCKKAKKLYSAYPNFICSFAKQNEVYNRDTEDLISLESKGNVFVVWPPKPVTIGRAERSKVKMQALYEEGYSTLMNLLPQLKAYLAL